MRRFARCRIKATPKMTESHSYVMALCFRCVCLGAKSLRNALAHMYTFHQSDKLVTIYCLQAANQHRSATMPSCKVGVACCIALLFAFQCCSTLQLQPGSLHMQYTDIASRQTFTFASWVWWYLGIGWQLFGHPETMSD